MSHEPKTNQYTELDHDAAALCHGLTVTGGRHLAVHPDGLTRRELLDGGELAYIPEFFDRATADALFAELRDGIPWEHVRIRGVPQKLATYWIGSMPYAYSRQTRAPAP